MYTKLRIRVVSAAVLVLVAASCGGGDDADEVQALAPSASTAPPTTSTTVPTTTSTTVPTAGTVGTTRIATTRVTTTSTDTFTTTTLEGGPAEMVVTVKAGSVEGGGRFRVELDAEVRLIVTADVADEVHLHGYGLFVDVTPGTPATLEFVADIPGIFEVELEGAGLVLFEVVVEP